MARIAIIGGGNMGEALLSGLLRANRPAKDLLVVEKAADKRRALSDKHGVRVTADMADAVETADIVIISVKPTDVDSALTEIGQAITAAGGDSPEQQLFVTIAAGVSTGYLESKLPVRTPVVRVMPNTPVLVGVGASVLAKGRHASAEQLDEIAALFECVGSVAIVPETQMDAVTAVSGSGPAYFFLLVEALVDAAVGAGLSRALATELAVQTMAGSAAMLLDRISGSGPDQQPAGAAAPADTSPAQLRAAVTSPGGTTAAALRELEHGGLRAAVDRAVQAGKSRSEQLRITPE